jgi:hypothetical protein
MNGGDRMVGVQNMFENPPHSVGADVRRVTLRSPRAFSRRFEPPHVGSYGFSNRRSVNKEQE